ncbi:hypothetical protein, partial [Stenotrophomonas sp. YIM B06876]|uniref:hypothetical protein n=1 Tax=Stenotrophomonas sp. YIM B06876 TaxID=3060211 RepID=UPI0027387C31
MGHLRTRAVLAGQHSKPRTGSITTRDGARPGVALRHRYRRFANPTVAALMALPAHGARARARMRSFCRQRSLHPCPLHPCSASTCAA